MQIYILVGLFVFIALIAGSIFVVWLSGSYNKQAYEQIIVLFPGSVNGLSDGSSVRYRGVQVGRVIKIALVPEDPTKISARIEVLKSTPLRNNTTAELQMLGITGLAFVDLSTKNLDSPPLTKKPGDEYPIIYGSESTLAKVITDFPKMLERYQEVADRINKFLSDDNAKNFSGTMANLESITATLNATKGEVESTMQSIQESSLNLKFFLHDAEESMDSFSALTNKLKENPSSLIFQPPYQGYEIP